MKYIKCRWLLAMIMSCSLFSCTNLDEEVFDRVDAGIYYQDETSVQGAVAAIYSKAAYSYLEYFWYLQEFSADQVAWRSWNGGLWGWDEALKFALSSHTWTSESTIIRQTWENAWTTIGLCNTLITDLQAISPASIRMTEDALNSYIAEVRTLRAWAYYNIFEIWGGALPLNITDDYRDIYSINNVECPEVVMALAMEVGQVNTGWMRNMPFMPYNCWDYFGGTYSQSGWNCVCLAPSWDNSGNVQPYGGTDNPKSFLTDYGDKLGAVYERFHDKDIRKQNYVYNETTGNYQGIFLKGAIKANYGKGAALKADADRDGQDLVYVDQVGTFLNLGRNLETVMSPRWGETNSGVRLVRYPVYPESAGIDFQNIDEVEFRLSEVVYTLAECKMRAGDTEGAKELVYRVKTRYFTDKSALEQPGPGFTSFDMDWMLSEWGLEFLGEGRRRRTDLRRFDKFTQGQWWFFGRATDDGLSYPAKRDRKYEWYPLPQSALMVNPGLVQNPNY